jgi:hypothetical protein
MHHCLVFNRSLEKRAMIPLFGSAYAATECRLAVASEGGAMSLRALKRWFTFLAGIATLATAAVVTAAPQESGQELPPCTQENEALPPCPGKPQAEVPPPEVPPKPHRRHNRIFAPSEISLTSGAGVADYFGRALTAHTDTGASWDARATFGAHSIIALEAGYIGSVNQIDVSSGQVGHVNSNGLDGTLRLQLPFKVQPYVFGGVGWNHMTVDNGNANPNITSQFVRETDDQVTIPAGAGFGYVGRHATFDVRGTYRLIPDNNITVMSNGGSGLHQWIAQARIGYVF